MSVLTPKTKEHAVSQPPYTRARLVEIVPETPDTSTYHLTFPSPLDRSRYAFAPGQFNMIYIFGVGEVPISLSSPPGRFPLEHTIRSTGRVTDTFKALRRGDDLLLRGPFGKPWPLEAAFGRDLLVVAGGLGFAPLRPLLLAALARRERFDRVIVLAGARGPDHVLFREEIEFLAIDRRARVDAWLTVDVPEPDWPYAEGLVTELFEPARLKPDSITAFICGPEVMMRACGEELVARGVSASRMFLSFERNMQCAERLCGHCQIGERFVCADGPVFSYEEASAMLEVREL